MQQTSQTATIRTMKIKEVPLQENKRKKFSICSLPVRIVCETLILLLIFIPLIVFLLKWPNVKEFIHGKVLSKTRLAPMSDGLESWTNSPVETVRGYRLFNIKNYMDIMTSRNNPLLEFEETKPTIYKVNMKKNEVQWLEDDKKIHYAVERLFTRDGKFDETVLNQEGAFIDILRVMFRTQFPRIAGPPFYALAGNNAFNYSKAIDKLEGFISPLFAAISTKMKGPNKDKYGFIYRYNGSNGFNYTIHSGIDNSSMKGQMIDFASEYTSFKTTAADWKTDIFDGFTFPPLGNPPNRKVINVFQPDFCRPLQLRYNQTISMFGIDQVHEYVLKLVDADKCPEMDENCPESDKLDITKCLSADVPEETVFLTKPHMYGHNSSYTNVEFTPDAEKHESKIYFEPMTGTPLRVQSRIQLNANAWIDRIKIDNDGASEPTQTRAVRRFIPMMWIDQKITLNEATLNRLKRVSGIMEKGHKAHQSLRLVYILLILFSLIAIVTLAELFFWNRKNRKLNQKKKPQNEPKIFISVQRSGESSIKSNTNDVANHSINTNEII